MSECPTPILLVLSIEKSCIFRYLFCTGCNSMVPRHCQFHPLTILSPGLHNSSLDYLFLVFHPCPSLDSLMAKALASSSFEASPTRVRASLLAGPVVDKESTTVLGKQGCFKECVSPKKAGQAGSSCRWFESRWCKKIDSNQQQKQTIAQHASTPFLRMH